MIVVGNGVAGHSCASRLAELGVPVTMIGPGLPHDRPPLSKRALASGRLPILSDAAKLIEKGITHLDGTVTEVDLGARRLVVTPSDEAADAVIVDAARLVWATGLVYPKPPVPGLETAEENATGAGMLALHRRLAEPGRRVVVIGAGLIGTETAATLAANHRVTLVDMVDRPLARFLPRLSDAARDVLHELDVRFVGDCRIEAVTAAGPESVVETSTHGALTCDVVVSAAGFRTSLPAALAGEDPRALAMPADATLRVVGHDDLWACGDCVSFPHPRWGQLAIPHWDHAHWSGRHVAASITGSSEPYVREPYFFSDIGRLRIQQVGVAAGAVEWSDEAGLIIGRDAAGVPACVVLINAPARLREARELVALAS